MTEDEKPLRPLCWPDGDVGDGETGHAERVERVDPHIVAPPVEVEATFGILEREEDEDGAEGDADVEPGGEDKFYRRFSYKSKLERSRGNAASEVQFGRYREIYV